MVAIEMWTEMIYPSKMIVRTVSQWLCLKSKFFKSWVFHPKQWFFTCLTFRKPQSSIVIPKKTFSSIRRLFQKQQKRSSEFGENQAFWHFQREKMYGAFFFPTLRVNVFLNSVKKNLFFVKLKKVLFNRRYPLDKKALSCFSCWTCQQISFLKHKIDPYIFFTKFM